MHILQSNLQIITTAPLQLYSSILIFAPSKSIIRNLFKGTIPKWICLQPKVENNWSQCIQTLEGHSLSVMSVAFSHDSSVLASASYDGTVRLWHASTGKCVQTLSGHGSPVLSVAFSHDSSFVVSGSHDNSIRLWHTNTGECFQILRDHCGSVKSVALSHNSSLIASASGDGTIRIWRTRTNKCIQILNVPYFDTACVVFSHDSSIIASNSGYGTIHLWDTTTGECIRRLRGGSSATSVAFSSDSSLIAAASGSIIRLWRTDTGDCIRKFKGHFDSVNSISFSHNSSLLASASDDNTIRLWQTTTGDCIQELNGHNGEVECVTFSYNSSTIASASRDGIIRLWHVNIDDDIQESKFNTNEVIPREHAEINDRIQGIEGYGARIDKVAFSHDSSLLASLSFDGTVRTWRTDTGGCVQQFQSRTSPMYSPQNASFDWHSCLVFSHDSSLVAFSLGDTSLWLCSVDTGECIHELKGHDKLGVRSASFSYESLLVASTSAGIIRVWRVDKGHCLRIFKIWGACSVAFSPEDSSLIASVADDDSRVWSIITGECVQILENPKPFYHSVAFSHDSSLVAATFGGTIQLWLSDTGECVHEFHTHKDHFLPGVSFALDNFHLLTPVGIFTTVEGEYSFRAEGYGFNVDRSWITWNGNKLLWVPSDYRSHVTAVNKSTVAVGCTSGRVWIMRFSAYTQ